MGLFKPARVLVAGLAILPFARADVPQVGKLEERVTARLEFSTPASSEGTASVQIESGDTISHVLYAIKLKIGSRIPLYGRKSLVERYAKFREMNPGGATNCASGCETLIVAGRSITVPLEIFDVSKVAIESGDSEESRRPAQADAALAPVAAPAVPATLNKAAEGTSALVAPPVAVAAPATVAEAPAEKFPRWALGVGLGYRSLDGEERTNHTHANLVSKITQRVSLSRFFLI